MWFYRSLGRSRPDTFPAIELVWPDLGSGAFPWDDGYDTGFFDAQKLLCGDQAFRQALERGVWAINGVCEPSRWLGMGSCHRSRRLMPTCHGRVGRSKESPVMPTLFIDR